MLGTSGHRVNGSDNREILHKSSPKRSSYINKSTITFEIISDKCYTCIFKIGKILGNNIAVYIYIEMYMLD